MSTTTTLPPKAAPKLAKPVANGLQPESKTKTVPKMKSAVGASKAPLAPTNPQPKIIPQAFDSGIRVYPGPIKKQPVVAKTSRPASAASQTSSVKPIPVKQKIPTTDAPIVVKKSKARNLDRSGFEDPRSVSTSTTASNASTASTLSVASTATSMSAASAKSTETVKPNGIAKSKQPVLPTKVKAKPQDTATGIQSTTKKVPSTDGVPLSKDQQKAKLAATKLNVVPRTVPSTPDVGDAAPAAQLPKKIITKKKQPAEPTATVPSIEQPKGEPLGAKSVNGIHNSADAPITKKKKVVKPKLKSNLDTAAAAATVEVPSAKAEPGKTELISQPTAPPLEPTTPSSKKFKVPKLNGTVKKTILKPRPQPTLTDSAIVPFKPVPLKKSNGTTKSALTTETQSVPKPASRALAAATAATKRVVSAPISATPRSIKAPRIKPRSTTPPPAGIQRPQTDGPAVRRKSVSFRSPLEAFQIIPARRASTPPPSTSSRRSSIASIAKIPEQPKQAPVEEPQPADLIAEQQPVDEVDADDLVFQDEQDEFDQLPDMSALRPQDPETVIDNEQDTSKPSDAPATLDSIPEEPTEPSEPPIPSDAASSTATTATDHDNFPTTTTTAAPSMTSYRPPSATDHDDDEDDSTVFFDADESYVPHHSGSPRKSGTPRLRTPGSAGSKLPKLGRVPDLKDSPKLNLLRLNSPVRKVKKRKSVGEKVKEGVARFEGVKGEGKVVGAKEGETEGAGEGEAGKVGEVAA